MAAPELPGYVWKDGMLWTTKPAFRTGMRMYARTAREPRVCMRCSTAISPGSLMYTTQNYNKVLCSRCYHQLIVQGPDEGVPRSGDEGVPPTDAP